MTTPPSPPQPPDPPPKAGGHGEEDKQEWVLPLVVRIERADPPSRTDALEAAAAAVLRMLADPEPSWRDAVRAWDGSRIRKVVRRARGADWRRAERLPGRTTVHGTAEVRAFPPVPVDDWPPELARLQVGGTELDDVQPPAPPPPGVAVVLLNPAVTMSAGKAMAQAGHAAQLGWRAASGAQRDRWRASGFVTAVRTATPEQWRDALAGGAPLVRDAGFTEVAPGSATAAIVVPRPGSAADLDRVDWFWSTHVPTSRAGRAPVDWAQAGFTGAPRGLRLLLGLGWRYGLLLDVAPAATPGRVFGWRVAEQSPDRAVLAAHSRLGLDSRLVFTAPPGRVQVDTAIGCTNRGARLVWSAIAPLHRLILGWLVRHAAAR